MATKRKGITITTKKIPTPPVVSVATNPCVARSAPAPWQEPLTGRKKKNLLIPVAAHHVNVLNVENREMFATPALFTMKAQMQGHSALDILTNLRSLRRWQLLTLHLPPGVTT